MRRLTNHAGWMKWAAPLVLLSSMPLLADAFSAGSFQRPATKRSLLSPMDEHKQNSRSFLPHSRHLHPGRRRHVLTRSRRHSDYNVEMGDPVQTLVQTIRATAQYTFERFVSWCDRPLTQVQQWSILLVYYFFHLMVLSQHSILFPWQLIPNNKGHFCSVGWDTVAGMISLAMFVYVKRGSVYFRKPWRRLLEDGPSDIDTVTKEKPTATSDRPSDTITKETLTAATRTPVAKTDEEKKEMDAVVSQVLEQAPRQIGLQRSKPKQPDDISSGARDESANQTPTNSSPDATPSPSSNPKQPDDMSSGAREENSNETPTILSPDATLSLASDESIEATKKSPTAAVPDREPPSSPSSQTDAISQSPTEKTESPAAAPTESEEEGVIPPKVDIDTEFPTSKSADSTSSTKQDETKNSVVASSSASQPSEFKFTLDALSETLKPLNDAFEGFKRLTTLAGDSANNNTRVEKQGPDLSSLKLPSMRGLQWSRLTSFVATMLLVNTYFYTGRFSFFWEDTLYAMAGVGFPLTVAMHRSLCVLLGHLTWVAVGSLILGIVPRPRFFGRNSKWYRQSLYAQADGHDEADIKQKKKRRNWVWWVICGYSISAWFFNASDFVNLYALPSQVLEDAIAQEGVVTQLINPENNDFLASLVGYIAPCISAPWWEEILYRGFFFPALTLFVPVWASVLISGIVFSAHHLSLTAALPLAVLGWTWSGLYMASDNLWSTIIVHALWNSRVFLSSWLGV